MRVNCPNCAAGYEVPDHLLAAGARTLRCARCGTMFQAGIAVGEAPAATPSSMAIPPPPAAVEPPPLAYPRAPPTPAEQRVAFHSPMVGARANPLAGSGALLGVMGWVLTAALLVGGTFEAVQQRSRIVAAWPASTRIYDALGLNPAAAGPSRPAPTPPAAAR